jgi:LmbE family N-acetylglucosaminyl deacetylase
VPAPLGAVSPHLDDLALSCASLLGVHPGSWMVTVFAGGPPSVDPLTGGESPSGMFEAGADIVGARRAEDARAASVLGCEARHLDHWDEQYRHPPYGYEGAHGPDLVRAVAADLETLIGRSALTTWLIPLGISHPDHQIAAAACLEVADRLRGIDWLIYEELPYALHLGGTRDQAVAGLRARGFELVPAEDLLRSSTGPRKLEVVGCYVSQVGPLGDGVADAVGTPERIHRLARQR